MYRDLKSKLVFQKGRWEWGKERSHFMYGMLPRTYPYLLEKLHYHMKLFITCARPSSVTTSSVLDHGSSNFPIKNQAVNIFSFVGFVVSTASSHLCLITGKQ